MPKSVYLQLLNQFGINEKPKFSLSGILKIIDLAMQVFIYVSFLLLCLGEFYYFISNGRATEYFINMTAALFAPLGFYQLLSFVIQLLGWYHYPKIYNSRALYFRWTAFALIVYAIVINNDPGFFIVILLHILLHWVAYFYFRMSFRETKEFIYPLSKD